MSDPGLFTPGTTVDGLSPMPARVDLPVQPTDLGGLRAWALIRLATAAAHRDEVSADDDGRDERAKVEKVFEAWEKTSRIFGEETDIGVAWHLLRMALAVEVALHEQADEPDRPPIWAACDVYQEAGDTAWATGTVWS